MDRQEHERRVEALFGRYQDWFVAERRDWGMYEIAGNPGWLPIIEDLLAGIEGKLSPDKAASFRINQIKEKFGTLRFYYESQPMFVDSLGSSGPSTFQVQTDDNPFEEIDGLINDAVSRSARTCVYCGDAGSIRTDGWWLTVCDYHQWLRAQGKTLERDFELMTSPQGALQ